MLPLLVAILLHVAVSFSPSPVLRGRSTTSLSASFSTSPTLNNTLTNDEVASLLLPPGAWNGTLAVEQLAGLEAQEAASASAGSVVEASTSSSSDNDKRSKLKRELARVAITGFRPDALSTISEESSSEPRTAECIMKELEQMNPLPIISPATHHSLNAHWSFVFTGVPTVGMRLITILSRISVLFPFEILDFRDVALCVEDEQSKAKALVEVKVCGAWELLLEVCTSLKRPTEEDLVGEYKEFRGKEGTLLLEHFQGIQLNGVEIPTPGSWHTTRTLEITYMDKDIMIARTSGGEPHLLLRNSPLCYTPEEMMLHTDDTAMEDEIELCDLEGGNKWTEFFSEAIEIYGERITRCLVDRDFGKEEFAKKEMKDRKKDDEWWKQLSSGMNLGNPWGEGDN